ncbi:DivIVA domain-containing protein [Iamia sp.]|uniref:DivIVA domain-containing protein n=1 Tax=Iamia sp. TaxID=2722710 RepID=UPI002C294715|nr:DivIVA domain-containing protein [Iamia sp.]HXH59208.1 DivIVA domain-containing protein [Iamia sp.]
MTGNETRLGPDDLVGRDFAIGLRGYDRDEVDTFLAQAADAWRASMSSAPPINGLSSSAMAALAEADGPEPAGAAPSGDEAVDPFVAPVASDPFAAPVAPPSDQPAEPALFEPVVVEEPAPAAEPEPAPAPTAAPATDGVVVVTRAEADRDRTAAYAERKAAELDRAQARTELAQAQEDALHVVDQAQRRADVMLTGARDNARSEAEAVLEDARSRLTPLLEEERAVRARLTRIRSELDAITSGGTEARAPELPDAAAVVTATEDSPETPEAPFPVGYGSVSVG